MAEIVDHNGVKRKRSPGDVLPQSRPQPPAPSATASNAAGLINYLTRQKNEKLKLIEGDNTTFSDVLQLLDEYEGILRRRESLAGNLGASLVGPLLLDAFEHYFKTPIILIGTTKGTSPTTVSWVDVVNFAREHPESFFLENASDAESVDGPQVKVCRFWIKNQRLQISENDFRLIVSGVPARMLPEQLNPDDENAELVTLDILGSRLSVLIKKADEVASRTRQLNYAMKGRKNAILARRSGDSFPLSDQQGGNQNSGEWPSQSNNSPYLGSGPSEEDLLRQFSLVRDASTPGGKNKAFNPTFTSINQSNQRSSPHPRSKKEKALQDDPPYRALMVSYIEKLNRGDNIWPPCDRCRRLKLQCVKNYTACLGCTKKHCKCYFREVETDEILLAGLQADSEDDASSEAAEKKARVNSSMKDTAPDMMTTTERPNENMSGYGQDTRDVEMGGVSNDGMSRPGSANNSSRYTYDPASVLLSAMENQQSSNDNASSTGYSSGNSNTMTATMTVQASGNAGSSQGGYGGMSDPNYVEGTPVLSASDNYHASQTPQTPLSTRDAQQSQEPGVNYIRPIGNASETQALLRQLYPNPDVEYRSPPQQQREVEVSDAFYTEMQRATRNGVSAVTSGSVGETSATTSVPKYEQ